jgi:hypothetical protein
VFDGGVALAFAPERRQLLAIVLTEVSASMPLADILASNPLAS